MSDTTYKSKVGYKPPVELEYHEGMPEIKSVKILDQVEEHVVAQCSAAVGMKIDREELIKALRYDRGQYEKGYADGKRDAIDRMEEALQAAEPTEKQVVDYCHKRCLVVLEADLFQELKASYGKMPKLGEWVHGREIGKEWVYDHWDTYFEDWRCSNCGVVFKQESKPKYHYCPNCGAKMEVRDADS